MSTDLRSFLRGVEELGELRRVDSAGCEEDIGMATEVLQHEVGLSAQVRRAPTKTTARSANCNAFSVSAADGSGPVSGHRPAR